MRFSTLIVLFLLLCQRSMSALLSVSDDCCVAMITGLFQCTVTVRRPRVLGGDAAPMGGLGYVVMSAHGGCPSFVLGWNSNRNLRGMPSTSVSHSSGASTTTRSSRTCFFVYSGCGIGLFGLCVMALGMPDMNVWKV